MDVTLFFLFHLLVAIVFAGAWFGLGRRVFGRLPHATAVEDVAFSTVLGLGSFGTFLFLAGVVGLLHRGTVLLGVAASYWVSRSVWRAGAARVRELAHQSPRRFAALVAGGVLAGVLLVPVLLLPLYPPHTFDAIMYHLPAAKVFAREHALVPTPYQRFCVIPQMAEVHFAAMMLVWDDLSAQMVQTLAFLLTAAGIFGWTRRSFGLSAAVIATGLWLAAPEALKYAGTGYVDLILTVFSALGVLALVTWFRAGERSWLVAGSALLGFAAATKYPALFAIFFFGVLLIGRAIRTRDWKPVAIMAVVCSLAGGPWYLRNAYYTGTPFSPFLHELFGPGCWSMSDAEMIKEEQGSYGHGGEWRDFLRLPYDLTFRAQPFGGEKSGDFLPLLVPLGLAAGLISARTRVLALFALAYMVFWFLTARISRYLLPIYPIWAVLVSWFFAQAVGRLPKRAATALAVVIGMLLAGMGVVYARKYAEMRGPIPTTARERDLFLHRFPRYRCYQWLNARHGAEYRVFSFYDEYMTYFADGTRIGDVLGVGRYKDMQFDTAENLHASLLRHRADYVMVPAGMFQSLRADPFWTPHFDLVCGAPDVELWRVDAPRAVPLLINGDFEQEDRLAGWSRLGNPDVITSEDGSAAVAVTSADYVFQELAVRPDRLYTIEFAGTAPGEHPRPIAITIHWKDAVGRTVSYDVQRFKGTDAWMDYAWSVLSPSRAVAARFSFHSAGVPVTFDRIVITSNSGREDCCNERIAP